MNRFSENAQWPVPRLRTSNHAVGPGAFRSTGPRASRAARMLVEVASGRLTSRLPCCVSARRSFMIRCAGRTFDGTGLGALERRVASPRGVVAVGPLEDRRRRRRRAAPRACAARTRARPAPRTSRRSPRPDTRRGTGRIRCSPRTARTRRSRRGPRPTSGTRSLAAVRVGGGKRSTNDVMSTTRSAITGKFAMGSTVTRPASRSARRVTQARASRPFTRIPQVPHEACRHEWRIASEGSRWTRIQRRASSTVAADVTSTWNTSNRDGPPSRVNRNTRNSRAPPRSAGVAASSASAGVDGRHHAAK